MSTTTYPIHLPSFKAAALSATSDKARPVLAAVAILDDGAGTVGYMATDSYKLAMVVPFEQPASTFHAGDMLEWVRTTNTANRTPLLVPCELVAQIVKWKAPKVPGEWMSVTFDDDGNVTASNKYDGQTCVTRALQADFPAVGQLLTPGTAVPQCVTSFKPEHLLDVMKGATALGDKSTPVTYWGDVAGSPLKPTYWSCRGHDAMGVWLLMPVRTDGVTWNTAVKAGSKAAAA